MRVIITGGTGQIGRRLAPVLLKAGHEVIVLSRDPSKHEGRLPPAVRLHPWDGRSATGWHDLIEADTAIINLAGENPAASLWTQNHKRRVLQSRLDAASAVVQAVQQAKARPKVLLQASAVGYYGEGGGAELTEFSPCGFDWRAEVCRRWEAAVGPVSAMGVRVCTLRIGIVLDAEGGALPTLRLAAQLGVRHLGDGRQWIPWIHHEDMSYSTLALLTAQMAYGPLNIVGLEPATNAELMTLLRQHLGRPATLPVPRWAMRLVVGELADAVLFSQRVRPSMLAMDVGYEWRFPKLADAVRDLLR
ncbi:MAG: TIGR01777 family oxidoreductase [Anaerolineae bacterium]|nr:TIGR01777 family oxidoreductase [Anaerolineae bacterium]MDW8172072.1 TIGR01777 family oxidoreductase [Anaerolineae bacterium]